YAATLAVLEPAFRDEPRNPFVLEAYGRALYRLRERGQAFAVTTADLELPRENDDELSARRRVPVEEPVLRPDAERDLRGRQTLEPVGLLLDVDRLEMRLPVRPGVEPPGLLHRALPSSAKP